MALPDDHIPEADPEEMKVPACNRQEPMAEEEKEKAAYSYRPAALALEERSCVFVTAADRPTSSRKRLATALGE